MTASANMLLIIDKEPTTVSDKELIQGLQPDTLRNNVDTPDPGSLGMQANGDLLILYPLSRWHDSSGTLVQLVVTTSLVEYGMCQGDIALIALKDKVVT